MHGTLTHYRRYLDISKKDQCSAVQKSGVRRSPPEGEEDAVADDEPDAPDGEEVDVPIPRLWLVGLEAAPEGVLTAGKADGRRRNVMDGTGWRVWKCRWEREGGTTESEMKGGPHSRAAWVEVSACAGWEGNEAGQSMQPTLAHMPTATFGCVQNNQWGGGVGD